MKSLPKKIIRLDDGSVFVLIEETQTYRLQLKGFEDKIHDSYFHQYTYERLMEDPRSKGAFKVADGTEDVETMKRNWLKSIESHNDGHGDDE